MNSDKGRVTRGFNILAADTNWIKGVLEIYVLEDHLNEVLNKVSNFIPFGLIQRKTIFSEGHVNFKMAPSKLVRLSELRMLKSSLFHSITVEEKEEFLK